MAAHEWAALRAQYLKVGFTEAQLLQKIHHLERRGPVTVTVVDQIERARASNYVARQEYLEPDQEPEALTTRDGNGFPDIWLERVRNRLLVVTPHGWINPRSRFQYKAGLHSFGLRGIAYHAGPAKRTALGLMEALVM